MSEQRLLLERNKAQGLYLELLEQTWCGLKLNQPSDSVVVQGL
jgi:hypothetical protein